MTLVEMLLVVFIVALLTVMLLPVSPGHHRPAKIARARFEMADLVNAIEAYETDCNRLPLAEYSTNKDITLGIKPVEFQEFQKIPGTSLIDTNSDLMVVLMDFNSGVNANHKLNPKQIKYLNAKLSGNTNSSGVGIDFQYRDPWGNPYVISLDANQDGFVRDAFYSCPNLYPANSPTSLTKTNGLFQRGGKVMVWSRGPDGKASIAVPAKSGVNKDNVISWE